jgi:hypothetical protein
MAVGMDELVRRFRHHPPKDGQRDRFEKVRQACLDLAVLVDTECPDSREKTLALTHLDDVMFNANAAIARRD